MKLFKTLSNDEAAGFRQWARDNYKPFDPISGVWHPVVQAECVAINAETEGKIFDEQFEAFLATHLQDNKAKLLD